jgi:hypothetical protein
MRGIGAEYLGDATSHEYISLVGVLGHNTMISIDMLERHCFAHSVG